MNVSHHSDLGLPGGTVERRVNQLGRKAWHQSELLRECCEELGALVMGTADQGLLPLVSAGDLADGQRCRTCTFADHYFVPKTGGFFVSDLEVFVVNVTDRIRAMACAEDVHEAMVRVADLTNCPAFASSACQREEVVSSMFVPLTDLLTSKQRPGMLPAWCAHRDMLTSLNSAHAFRGLRPLLPVPTDMCMPFPAATMPESTAWELRQWVHEGPVNLEVSACTAFGDLLQALRDSGTLPAGCTLAEACLADERHASTYWSSSSADASAKALLLANKPLCRSLCVDMGRRSVITTGFAHIVAQVAARLVCVVHPEWQGMALEHVIPLINEATGLRVNI